jgi:hypothetical protein
LYQHVNFKTLDIDQNSQKLRNGLTLNVERMSIPRQVNIGLKKPPGNCFGWQNWDAIQVIP